MPATIHYSAESLLKPAVQLNSSFTQHPDGFLEIPLTFMLTPRGLSDRIVENLLPKPGLELPRSLYNIRNLPDNRGLFVNKSEIVFENGLYLAKLICASCLVEPQYWITTNANSKAFNGSALVLVGDIVVTRYWSFLLKAPSVSVQTAHRSDESPTKKFSVTIGGNGQVTTAKSVMKVRSFGYAADLEFQPRNIIDRNALLLDYKFWDVVESIEQVNLGSIVRSNINYTLGITER